MGSPVVFAPRTFLHSGRRIKSHPGDDYRFGADRGDIDERWFGSTTEAANKAGSLTKPGLSRSRVSHEGLSCCLFEGKPFLLKVAVAERGADLVGEPIFSKYDRWPVYSKFFDNMGPIPHHMHQSFEDAKKVGQEGKPESDYFPPQLNNVDNNFAYTFMGLEPVRDEGRSGDGFEDVWVVYGTVDGDQLFSAKELTIQPGAKCVFKDGAASGWITVQGRGRIGALDLQTPAMIHFGENTTDEVFISYTAASRGVEIENLGSEPLVGLRYFGPDAHADFPKAGS